MAPGLPLPRGPVSEFLLASLTQPVHALAHRSAPAPEDPFGDEDLHLALYLCYELHYRGLPGVDERWEWEPSLLALRQALERHFEGALLDTLGSPAPPPSPEDADLALRAVAEADEEPSLSVHLERQGTLDEVLEFVVHRSAYQLKEADPHSFTIPRLDGAAKAAIVEIQVEEYGGGRPERIHATLFAGTMRALGLDPRYGAYLDHVPGPTLATVNLMSLFGLHRRLLGAAVGHLALFEMTSSVPNRRYAGALRRLGFGEDATAFFDEHVMADAVHESIAAVDLAGGLLREDPVAAPWLLWGARALVEMDARWSRGVLEAWSAGMSSLRQPVVATSSARDPVPATG